MLEVPEYCTKTVTVAEKHREYEVIKDVTYYFIELPKFRKSRPRLANMLEVWLALIDGEGGLIEMGKEKYEIVEEVQKQLEELLADEELRAIVEYRESALRDENSKLYNAEQKGKKERTKATGKKSGLKQGKKQLEETTIEIAKKLKQENMSIEKIAEITGIEKEKIEKL